MLPRYHGFIPCGNLYFVKEVYMEGEKHFDHNIVAWKLKSATASCDLYSLASGWLEVATLRHRLEMEGCN